MGFTFCKMAVVVAVLAGIGLGLSYTKFYAFHAAAVLFLLFWLARPTHVEHDTISRNIDKFFYFMLVWYVFSLAWALNLTDGLVYLFYVICGLITIQAVLIASRDIEDQQHLFKALSILFIVELGISVMEALNIARFPISSLSPYATKFGRQPIDLNSVDSGVAAFLTRRPTGFEWNTNNLAVLMLMLIPFFIFLKNRLHSLLGLALTMFCIIMSASRGVFIGAAVVVPVSYFIKLRKRRVLFVALVSAAFLVAPVVIRLMTASSYQAFTRIASSFSVVSDLISTGANSAGSSISLRQGYFEKGIAAFLDSRGLGVGAGGDRTILHGESLHNYWVEVLVNGGVVLFVAYIIWISFVFISLVRAYKQSRVQTTRYFAVACALSLVGFVIGCISASSVIYFFPKWLLYGFSVATIYNFRRESTARPSLSNDA